MATVEQVRSWRGRTILDRKGRRVGVLAEVYADDRTGEHWAAVDTGRFGAERSLAPLRGASPRGAELRLDVSTPRITGAPRVEAGRLLSPDDERLLFEHYGLDYDAAGSAARFAA